MTSADDLDHTPVIPGKYGRTHKSGGLTPDQIANIDPAYLCWAYESWRDKPCSKLLYDACREDIAEDRQQKRVGKDQDRE